MIDSLSYDLANDLLAESFTGGPLNGLSVTNGYDQFLRRTNLTALSASVLSRTLYGYDGASRLATVSDGTNTATYTYLANSPLVSQITYQQSGTTRMTTTKQYDYLNRLTQISSAPSAAYTLPLTYNYTYNPANQCTKDTLADGSYWVYGYDSLGQVTNGWKYFANGTLVPGQQFDYAFDTIGNRTNTQTGGDTNGANLRLANYHVNSLNQITNRDISPYVDIMGASILTNTVTVNGQTASRIQEYYRAQVPANNASTDLWTNVTVTGGQTVSGNVYVPKQPELFKYDADGNLTNDGRWFYTWDAENRLVSMTNYTGVGPAYKLAFTYDAKGRRIQKVVTTNEVTFITNSFLYDGRNLIAILSQIATLQSTFTWGNDLSGSQQGAGGVGGLQGIGYYGTSTTNAYVAYDGNENVSVLINAANGTILANYDYGPFGEVIQATGPIAKANPIRFSTKYADDESDMLYYGYRFYKPSTGTWPNRDPINEKGFDVLARERRCISIADENLYAFVANDAIRRWDLLGLIGEGDIWPPPPDEINPPPSGPFKKCRIALECGTVKRSGITLGTHCGLVIDTGDGVYDLNGSGGTENRRNLTPGSTGDATGGWTDNDPSVCECLFSNIKTWNDRHVPRSNTCNNSNWNLKCMNKKCNVKLNWGSQDLPLGYNCQECTGTQITVGTVGYGATTCCTYREKPCPDQ